jgi:hypothetical protein
MGVQKVFSWKDKWQSVENFKDKRVFFASIPHFPRCKHQVLLMTGERQERRIDPLTTKRNKKMQNRKPKPSLVTTQNVVPVSRLPHQTNKEEKDGDGGSLLRQKKNKKGKTVALDLYSFGSFCD